MSQLSVTQVSTDVFDSFGDPTQPSGKFSFSFSNAAYAPDTVGILANGTQITSGDPSQMVNELIVTAFSADLDPAILASETGITFSGTDAEQMQEFDSAFESALGNFAIDTCFAYSTGASTCDTVNVVTPEPTTAGMLVLCLMGICLLYYRAK